MKDHAIRIDNKAILSQREAIARIVKNVRDYKEFLTFEELQQSSERLKKKYPGIVESEIIGYSTERRPIELLKIGNGSRKAFWFGTPHPNEPIGTLALETLTEQLCRNPEILKSLDTTFLIVKSADPDGMVLNEGWFKRGKLRRKLSPLKYALNFYRPRGDEQAEWGFPIEYEEGIKFETSPSETQALMKVIEKYKPDFLYSLHNSAFRGAYFLLSQQIEALYPDLQRIVRNNGVPLHLGTAEVPWMKKFADGILSLPSAMDEYNYLKERGAPDSSHGGHSLDFLRLHNPNALTFICEIPYFNIDAISDNTPTKQLLSEVTRQGIEDSEKIIRRVIYYLDSLEAQGNIPNNRLSRSAIGLSRTILKFHEAQKQELDDPKYNRIATKADAFSAISILKLYDALIFGEVYRLAVEAGEIKTAEQTKREIKDIIKKIDKENPIRTIPLQQLVRIQLESGLLTMQYTGTNQ